MTPDRPMARTPEGSSQDPSRPEESRPRDPFSMYVMRRRRVWQPPTDVCEADRDVIIQVEVAGMREEDFSITLVNRRLIIAGVREYPARRLTYQNMEIRYGEFRTAVRIDWPLRESDIEATYENGFLYVRFPKPREYHVPIVTGDEASKPSPGPSARD